MAVDTYEGPAAIEIEDSLAKFREQARQRAANPKSQLSESQLAKLRTIREQDNANKEANKKFVEQFAGLPRDTWTLIQVLKRIYSSDQNRYTTQVAYDDEGCVTAVTFVKKAPQIGDLTLERMANKIRWCLRQGWSVTSPYDVTFFGMLTADEAAMTDEQFVTRLEGASPLPALHRIAAPKPCKSDKSCLRFEKRKPAPAKGKGEYCSSACAASDRARAKRALAATSPAAQPPRT